METKTIDQEKLNKLMSDGWSWRSGSNASKDRDALNGRIDKLSEEKVSLPVSNGTPNSGTAGQFAVSDGMGGIMWKTIVEAEEVSY